MTTKTLGWLVGARESSWDPANSIPTLSQPGPFQSFAGYALLKESRIRETKYLLTDADSSTDTTVGWTKNTQQPKFFEKRKKSSKTQKLKNGQKF